MGGEEPPEVVSTAPLELDRVAQRVLLDGRELKLTAKEFALVWLFAQNPGRVLPREVIEKEVWGGSVRGRTLDTHVSRLRRLLPPGAIQTVVRVGYRFDL